MGINLPARLVVIKSTQCYRGAGKGYQEYTQIEMDQMMGRAGRPPFDN
jgi:ATP-dependent DNA helicase HFM1/MER3